MVHTYLVSRLVLTRQPAMAEPNIWNATYRMHLGNAIERPKSVVMVTIELRWAPEIGPTVYINRRSLKTTITLRSNQAQPGQSRHSH